MHFVCIYIIHINYIHVLYAYLYRIEIELINIYVIIKVIKNNSSCEEQILLQKIVLFQNTKPTHKQFFIASLHAPMVLCLGIVGKIEWIHSFNDKRGVLNKHLCHNLGYKKILRQSTFFFYLFHSQELDVD